MVLEFYYHRISAVKNIQAFYGAANQKTFFFNSPVSLLAANRWPKSLRTLSTRLTTLMYCEVLWDCEW